MQISEYYFPLLSQYREDELNRDLEYRRLAIERMLDEDDGDAPSAAPRPTLIERLTLRLRGWVASEDTASPEHTAQPSPSTVQARTVRQSRLHTDS